MSQCTTCPKLHHKDTSLPRHMLQPAQRRVTLHKLDGPACHCPMLSASEATTLPCMHDVVLQQCLLACCVLPACLANNAASTKSSINDTPSAVLGVPVTDTTSTCAVATACTALGAQQSPACESLQAPLSSSDPSNVPLTLLAAPPPRPNGAPGPTCRQHGRGQGQCCT
jgi:hypothetical protein